jgi:uncharacterized membrane protein YdfJ with MMPL/SSD domain
MDAVDIALSEAPGILSLTATVAILLMSGLAFRSLLIPIRLLFTILVTLFIVAGTSVFVYQHVLQLDGLFWIVRKPPSQPGLKPETSRSQSML